MGLDNAAHGHEFEADYDDTNGTTLLKQVLSTYTDECPAPLVSGSPPVNGITWDGNLVSEVDSNNPVADCGVYLTQQTTKQFDGGSTPSTLTISTTYDSYGNVTSTTKTSNGGTPGTTVANTAYTWNDALNPTIGGTSPVAGTYLIDLPAFTDTTDSSGNRLVCHETQYDGQPYTTGSDSSIQWGFTSASSSFDSCGNSGNHWTPSNPKTASQQRDSYGNTLASDDADANAGDTTHQGCTANNTLHSQCTVYDGVTFAKPTTHTNAKNQTNTSSYGSSPTQSDGYQQWLISSTDANGNTTSYTYDALGRQTSLTEPGETTGDTTQGMVYANWCGAVGPQTPCVEEDTSQRLDSSTVVTTRNFYDGYHHLVETRTPGPNNQDVVTYTYYDVLGRGYASSSKYFVTAYTGAAGQAAFSIPDSTVATSQTTAYDGLSRALTTVDAISEQTTMSYSIVCDPVSGDTGCYEGTTTTVANHHRTLSLVDALGHQTYTFTYTGTTPYTQYAITKLVYDAAGRKIEQDEPNGGKATWTYDAAGRLLGSTDPDQGSFTYNYDANGNQTYIRDNRGDSTGTVILCYDGLNRKSKLIINGNSCTTGTTLATWSYDSGSNGQGHLTGETWASNGATGSYAYVFDGRGQQTGWTSTFGSSNYPFSLSYNDAGMPSTVTYPDGTVLTASYTSQGWPSAATVNRSGTNTTLVSAIGYSGTGGAAMEPTSASIGNGTYSAAYIYDGLAQLTSKGMTNVSTSHPIACLLHKRVY